MGNLLAYSGIVTKVHAMRAKLLARNDYYNIASCQSVSEVVLYLKDKPAYSYLLSEVDEHDLHRGDVEKILIQSLYNDYTRLYRFANPEQKKFLKLYIKRYEVELINYCLRIVFNHYAEPFDLNYKKAFFDEYSQLSIDKLITSSSVEELVENLRGTEYYEPLRKLRDTKEATLFDYDLALTLYYHSTTWKTGKKTLKKSERKSHIENKGAKIDLLNLQWIYRAKKYYNMAPPDIYSLLIPVRYRLRTTMLKAMVEAPTVEEMIQIANTTPYAKKFTRNEQLSLESLFERYLLAMYQSDERRNPYSFEAINTYLFLKELELKKLTTALECIRYGLSANDTLVYLGGGKKQ